MLFSRDIKQFVDFSPLTGMAGTAQPPDQRPAAGLWQQLNGDALAAGALPPLAGVLQLSLHCLNHLARLDSGGEVRVSMRTGWRPLIRACHAA